MNKTDYIIFLLLLISVVSCRSEITEEFILPKVPFELELPKGFESPEIPEDNSLTEERIALGKKLFFDKRLSRDMSVSCGTCHLPNMAFTDGLSLSEGIEDRTGMRNAPTLANVAYQSRLFWDGGSVNLEQQVLAPIGDENEFDFTTQGVLDRLNEDEEIVALAKQTYDRDEVDLFVVSRAIASFERTLMSGNSSYDRLVQYNETDALSVSAKEGMKLFFSEALACASCHSGFNFTDYGYHNIGLYEIYEDPGRERISNLSEDFGKFKTPSLRNVAVTGPYMHDGSIETLAEVLEHFDSGGTNHINKDNRIQPLELTSAQKTSLLDFLESLTDEEFLNNPDFKE